MADEGRRVRLSHSSMGLHPWSSAKADNLVLPSSKGHYITLSTIPMDDSGPFDSPLRSYPQEEFTLLPTDSVLLFRGENYLHFIPMEEIKTLAFSIWKS